MTETEVDQVVLDIVRKFTSKEVTPRSRFDTDLRVNEVGRQMLFASVAEAFKARGVSLPSHGFYQSNFLACPTPGDVCAAIRAKAFAPPGTKPKTAPAPAPDVAAPAPGAAAPAPSADTPAAAGTEASAPEATARAKKSTPTRKKTAVKKSSKPTTRRRPN